MLLTKNDFRIGQEVACMHVGNLARRNKGYSLGKVIKCGRKLITVEIGNHRVQFQLEENLERDYLLQKSNYAGDYELFPSKQAYLEFEEKNKKLSEIKSAIDTFYNSCKLNIGQIRRIHEIINE